MSKLTLTCLCAAALMILSACSAYPDPIIDERGVNMVSYDADREECESYADPISVGQGAAKGAAGGAAVGAATGAISGDIYSGAGYGAIFGATRYGNEADREKQMVVKRCLMGRGYRVLN
jgi:outer membrane lipoprotein SlyB